MQYIFNILPKSQIEIRVTIPFSEFEPHVKRAATAISEKIEIEGFRKGKAPYEQVRSKVGDAGIYEEAAELGVRVTYPEILKKIMENEAKGKTPIGKPEITVTKLASGNEFTYTIRLALLPEVRLPEYRESARRARADKKTVSVTDEEVSNTLMWLRESRAPLITVDRSAEDGDTVEIDFEIRHGGVKIEGGDSRNHPLVIGRGKFMPGFEEHLIGMKAGEQKSFTLIVPQEWREKSFAGKALDITAHMKVVQERKLAELTDAFAKTLGDFTSLEALMTRIRENIEQEKKEKESQRIRGVMIEAIARDAKIDVPDVLIESELEKMMHEFEASIENMGMKWSEYLLHIKKTIEELKKEWRENAGKRVRVALCLREIAAREHIEPTEEEIKKATDDYLRQFATKEQTHTDLDPNDLKEYTRGILRNEKVFEFLENL